MTRPSLSATSTVSLEIDTSRTGFWASVRSISTRCVASGISGAGSGWATDAVAQPANTHVTAQRTSPRMDTDERGCDRASSLLSVFIRVHPWLLGLLLENRQVPLRHLQDDQGHRRPVVV